MTDILPETRRALLKAIAAQIASQDDRTAINQAADKLFDFEVRERAKLTGASAEYYRQLTGNEETKLAELAERLPKPFRPGYYAWLNQPSDGTLPHWSAADYYQQLAGAPKTLPARGMLRESVLAAVKSKPSVTVLEVVDLLGGAATGDRDVDIRRVRNCFSKLTKAGITLRIGVDLYQYYGQAIAAQFRGASMNQGMLGRYDPSIHNPHDIGGGPHAAQPERRSLWSRFKRGLQEFFSFDDDI